MSGPLRSKQGCWTCRLRKKKCDEGHPRCSTCESLSITCFGFGPKPDWMDDSEKEKSISKSLKETVKLTTRRKASTQSSKQRDRTIRIAPKTSINSRKISSSGDNLIRQHGVIPLSGYSTTPEDGIDMLQNESTKPPPSEEVDDLTAAYMCSIPAEDSVLLMHFLDNVFPLQYPMYKPGVLEGGRGWLLSLTLRTKPLYHAVMAISLHHSRALTLTEATYPCKVAALVQQEKHLEICLKAVNQASQNSCPSNGPAILTAVVQLLFFELFTGQGNTWQPHLRAALNMYRQGRLKSLALIGLTEKSRKILNEDLPLPVHEIVIVQEVVNFRFLAGTLVWLDIVSSITSGVSPQLLPYHAQVISSNSQTNLENIMGSKNWVMIQIGRIAALHERKTKASEQGILDFMELKETADDISTEIQHGLTNAGVEDLKISELGSPTIPSPKSDSPILITPIFACMASVYLHLVTHGFQKLEVLDAELSRAMIILQTRISTRLLPVLVCPLYVLGSVSKQGDEQFFRNVFSTPQLLDPSLQHRGKILPVLEEIWRRRRTLPGFAWKDTLELTVEILLI